MKLSTFSVSSAALCMLAISAAACTQGKDKSPVRSAPQRSETQDASSKVPGAAEATPAQNAQAISNEPVGYTRPPEPQSKAEHTALGEALRIHRSGDHAASKLALSSIWKEGPNNSQARYNLACALSLLGEVEEAATHYAELLKEDLPHYRGRLAEDKDLEALRSSPKHSQKLGVLIATLDTRWKQASQGALPMIYWRGPLGAKNSDLRAGVWNPETERFIPLGRKVKGSVGAIVDLVNQRSLTLSRRKHKKRKSDEEFGGVTEFDFAVQTHPLYGEREAIFTMNPEMAHELEAFPVSDGIHVRWFTDFGTDWFTHNVWRHQTSPVVQGDIFTNQGRKLHIPEIPPRPFLYSNGKVAVLRDGGQTNFPGYIRYRWTSGPSKGFRVSKNALYNPHTKERIKLSPGHGVGWANNVLIDDSGDYAWVITQQSDCKHVIDQVYLPTGQLSLVGRGQGLAAARFHQGKLYLQRAGVTTVLERVEKKWKQSQELPAGIGFIYPQCS